MATPYFLSQLTPPILMGFLLMGLVSADTSTTDQYLLSWSTSIVNDCICPFRRTPSHGPAAPERRAVHDRCVVCDFSLLSGFFTGRRCRCGSICGCARISSGARAWRWSSGCTGGARPRQARTRRCSPAWCFPSRISRPGGSTWRHGLTRSIRSSRKPPVCTATCLRWRCWFWSLCARDGKTKFQDLGQVAAEMNQEGREA